MTVSQTSCFSQVKTAHIAALLIANLRARLKFLDLLRKERCAILQGDMDMALLHGFHRETLRNEIAALEKVWLRSLGCPPSYSQNTAVQETLCQAQAEETPNLMALWWGIRILEERIQLMSYGNIALISQGGEMIEASQR